MATIYPHIAKEWHPTKNGILTPFQVAPGSDKKAHWICQKGHTWETNIYQRTGKATSGCPLCFNVISKESNKVFKELKKHFPMLIIEGEIEDHQLQLKGWSGKYDAGLIDNKLLFEYDGAYFHKNSMEKDLRKIEHGIRLEYNVIRIRQAPLNKLTEMDVIVPKKFDPKVYAATIYLHTQELLNKNHHHNVQC